MRRNSSATPSTMLPQYATRIRAFIYSDLAAAYYRHSETFPEINRVITEVLQPNSVEMLGLGEEALTVLQRQSGAVGGDGLPCDCGPEGAFGKSEGGMLSGNTTVEAG